MTESNNREVLIRAAASLIRRKGYDGVGLAEILAASGLPKGSLYYHFPGGKRELAAAATLSIGAMIETLIDPAFAEARSFHEGVVALCREISSLIAPGRAITACPVASILQASIKEPELRDAARQVLANWTANLERQARRLKHPEPRQAADHLLMLLEGAWLLALAEQGNGPFERVAASYGGQSKGCKNPSREAKRTGGKKAPPAR